ncbi:MAG: Mur ligase family protein [Chloroflexota bacterium]|nr:Mur ligase family protein [Chloroflexota bacterium]
MSHFQPPADGVDGNANSGHFSDYLGAIETLQSCMRPNGEAHDNSPAAIRARAITRLERIRAFLAFLGNPQDAYQIVHVGGTSGKGSTSVAIAGILAAAGYRTGLHTSPYLQSATEKLQVNSQLVAGTTFRALVEGVIERATVWAEETVQREPLTYGEVSTALTFLYFARQQVNVAVIEVGAGGRFDLTNVVMPTISVITSIGLDHIVTLGSTIPEIAWHKAGIIKHGTPVVTAVTDPIALKPIFDEATAREAPVLRVDADQTYQVISRGPIHSTWREIDGRGQRGPEFVTALPGEVQVTNAATAVAAIRVLSKRGWLIDNEAIWSGLATARLPGRVERMPVKDTAPVLIDGAHNPQKMCAVAADIDRLLGRPSLTVRPIAVVGSIRGKDTRAMLRCLTPHVSAIVGTRAEVDGKESTSPEEIVDAARAIGFSGRLAATPRPLAAVDLATEWATSAQTAVVVTGSLFLVGEVRDRWYALREIVTQRTSWPVHSQVSGHNPE